MLQILLIGMSLQTCQISPDLAKSELMDLARQSYFEKNMELEIDLQQDGCTYRGIVWLVPPIPDTELLMRILPDGRKQIYHRRDGWMEKGKLGEPTESGS